MAQRRTTQPRMTFDEFLDWEHHQETKHAFLDGVPVAMAGGSDYLRRTVVLNADDARRDGIIDGIAAYPFPQGKPVLTISMKPNPAAAAKPPAGPPSQPAF